MTFFNCDWTKSFNVNITLRIAFIAFLRSMALGSYKYNGVHVVFATNMYYAKISSGCGESEEKKKRRSIEKCPYAALLLCFLLPPVAWARWRRGRWRRRRRCPAPRTRWRRRRLAPAVAMPVMVLRVRCCRLCSWGCQCGPSGECDREGHE